MSGLQLSVIDTVDRWRHARGWRLGFAIFALAVLLAAAAQLTYSTGGTRNVYLHAMYIPIALAGAIFRVPGGILAGLAGGLLVGPLMPIDAAAQTMQRTAAWLYRLGFFMLIGGFIGQLSSVLNMRLDQLHRVVDSLSHSYTNTLRAFTELVAYRDEQTSGHCDRVAHNARVIGEDLGLGQSELSDLYWAGILHDLGKVATPTEILLKPGALTEPEYEEIKKHAQIGADLLNNVSPDFAQMAEAVRTHHERWDGNGYPDGLSGTDIPLFGRILAVVDVFEALTSQRPYRGPMSPREALAHIKQQAGAHFDTSIVHLLERAHQAHRLYVSSDQGTPPQRHFPPLNLPTVVSASNSN